DRSRPNTTAIRIGGDELALFFSAKNTDYCGLAKPAGGRLRAPVNRQQTVTVLAALICLTAAAACEAAEAARAALGETVAGQAREAEAAAARLGEAETARRIAAALADGLREAIDAVPVPVWRRDAALALVDCNAAYAAALDSSREAILAEGRELAAAASRDKALDLARRAAAGAAQSEERHVVIGGSRRLLA